jgi:hypothetical protein
MIAKLRSPVFSLQSSVLVLGGLALVLACAPGTNSTRPARSTLVVGLDVSGSFRANYESSVDFASNYIYARLNGLGGLKQPTALFVGSIGGELPDETKSFQPIHTFQGLTVDQIREYLLNSYPSRDANTDFNPFFTRVAALIKRQNLVLSPVEVVLLTDGLPDAPAVGGDTLAKYKRIKLDDLEYLSKSVTLRVLFPRPTIAVNWEKRVPRHRVRMWTVDDEVMKTWRNHYREGFPVEDQNALWKWIGDNVDYRVRSVGVL